jgi:hypothetical protein
MDSLPARVGEAYERMMANGNRKNRQASGNLREQVIHNLPTPTVSDTFTDNLKSSQQSEGSMHSVTLAQIVHRVDLLPTPLVDDHKNNGHNESRFETLTSAAYRIGNQLLPTPNTMDSLPPRSPEKIAESKLKTPAGYSNLREVRNWGKYATAIERWEQVIGREAPAPTKADAKDGSHRLNSEFAEWMMGLPKGWVTGVGLSRAEELKACGNGVVPQQAKLALTILLEGLKW